MILLYWSIRSVNFPHFQPFVFFPLSNNNNNNNNVAVNISEGIFNGIRFLYYFFWLLTTCHYYQTAMELIASFTYEIKGDHHIFYT
jgi:hypothetical protein